MKPVAWITVVETSQGLSRQVNWEKMRGVSHEPLYTAPPQREWQGLTDEELLDIADMAYANDLELLQTLQTKLKEKNNG